MLARLAQGTPPSPTTPSNPAFTHYQQLLANPMMAQSMLHQLAARQSQQMASPERNPAPNSPNSSTHSVPNNQIAVDSDEAIEE